MLDATSYLKAFVEKLTQMNRGRAFFTTPETLGDYVLVDFIEQKRAMRTGGAAAAAAPDSAQLARLEELAVDSACYVLESAQDVSSDS